MMNTAMPAIHPIVGSALGECRPIPRPPPDHSPTIHVVRRVARIQPTGVRAERARIAERIHLLVVAVVVAHGSAPSSGSSLSRASTLGAPLRQRPMNFAAGSSSSSGVFRILVEVGAEQRHVFLQPGVRQVIAVARQHLVRQIGDEPVLVGIAPG